MDRETVTSRIITEARSPALLAHRSHVPMRVALDGVVIVAGLGLALLFRFGFGWFEVNETTPLTLRAHAIACVLWTAGLLGALALNRLYDEDTLFPGGGEISRLFRSAIEASAVLSAFVFLTQSFYVSRAWFALTVVLSTVLLISERLAVRHVLAERRMAHKGLRPAILISRTETWEDWPFENQHEFHVVARLDPSEFESFLAQRENLGEKLEWAGTAVVLKARDFSHDEFWRILVLAGELGWSVFVHSPVRSVGRDRLTVRELAGQTIVKVAPPVLTGPRAIQKRLLDVAISSVLLFVLSPLLLAIALSVMLTSGRPVLFSQGRTTRGGKVFRMVKFRTMAMDAERESGPVWTSVDDPRRTAIGRFLRRTSLDELPQLWNVLKGDMSLIGPRPERPSFVEDFEKDMTWYRFRHRMRPGITGWAQSHGLRGNTSLDSRVQFDNWYIENWSIWLDLKILGMTLREVVRGKNAY